jgi:hypothetical protein
MLSRFMNLFKPPILADPEKNSQARNIHTILLATMVLTGLFMLYAIFFPPPGQIIVAITMIALEFGLLFLLHREKVRFVSIVYTLILWMAIIIEVGLYGGIRDTGYAAATMVVVVASLTMGIRAGGIFTALTLLAGVGLIFAEGRG